jgi:hypothetical protein
MTDSLEALQDEFARLSGSGSGGEAKRRSGSGGESKRGTGPERKHQDAASKILRSWREFRSQFPAGGALFSRSSSSVEILAALVPGVVREMASELEACLRRLAAAEDPARRQQVLRELDGKMELRTRPEFVMVWRAADGRRFFSRGVGASRSGRSPSGSGRSPSGSGRSPSGSGRSPSGSGRSALRPETGDRAVEAARWALEAFVAASTKDPRVEGLADEDIDLCLAHVQSRKLGAKLGRNRLVFRRPVRKSVVAEGSLPARYLTMGGPQQGIIGAPGDRRFALPADVAVFLRKGKGMGYDWRLNPRRRRRVRGLRRKRWIMRVSHGFGPEAALRVVREIARGAEQVRRSRHWDLIFPRSIMMVPPKGYAGIKPAGSESDPAELRARIVRLIEMRRPATVVLSGGNSKGERGLYSDYHACVHVVRMIPCPDLPRVFDLDVVVLDPNANVTLSDLSVGFMRKKYAEAVAASGRELPRLTRAVRKQLEAGALGEFLIREVTVRAQPATPARELRVQYAYEGSCGPSSVALALAAARVSAKQPHLAAPALARSIFRQVSDLDVVVAAQLTHALV